MPSFTKKAIVESFLRIIGKKPLDKITVRDVVDDCGINRNTFYYYFQDIYAVLEELSHIVAESLPREQSLSVTFEAFFRGMAQYAASHPRIIEGLMMSLGLDGLERYFASDMDQVILSCLSKIGKDACSPTYLQRTTAFLRHAIFGFCFDLLRMDKAETFERALSDITQILRDVEQAFYTKN